MPSATPTLARPRRARLRGSMAGELPDRARTVLFVENSLGFGGSTVGLARLLTGLDRRRFRPLVVVSHPTQRQCLLDHGLGDLRIELLPKRPARAAFSTGLARRWRGLASLLDAPLATLDTYLRVAPYTRRLEELFADETLDLVHLNNSVSANMGALRFARRRGVPVVLKQRGYEWPSWDVRRLLGQVDHFIPDSQAIADHLVELGADAGRMDPTYCTLDVDRYLLDEPRERVRESVGLPTSGPVVGMTGCLQPWKGQHVFLEALALVRESIPGVRGVIVGDTPDRSRDAYLTRLERDAARLGLTESVLLTGHRDDVPRLLHAFDVFVHASVDPEPFGTVIAEAMAAGTPVVAANAGGPPEYVLPGKTGLLHTPGSAQELADAIRAQIEDRATALHMARDARALVRERFGLADHVERTEAIYTEVLARGSAVLA